MTGFPVQRDLEPAAPAMGCCPSCRVPTPLAHHGHNALCLPCTEEDIGMTLAQHRARINDVLNRGRTRKWRR